MQSSGASTFLVAVLSIFLYTIHHLCALLDNKVIGSLRNFFLRVIKLAVYFKCPADDRALTIDLLWNMLFGFSGKFDQFSSHLNYLLVSKRENIDRWFAIRCRSCLRISVIDSKSRGGAHTFIFLY